LLVLSAADAQAVNQEIRASFRPDPAYPNRNVFTNQTPISGYCASYPNQCTENNMFSIQLPARFESARSLQPGDGLSIKTPANWRQLTVTNAATQQHEIVEVRITGVGTNYILSHPSKELTGASDKLEGHQNLWTSSSWVNAPAPCRFSGNAPYGEAFYRFFWKTPVEAPCTKVAAFDIPSIDYDTLDFAYELRTPNPLGMSSGLYTGSMTYSISEGGDFDFGPLMRPDDNSLTLDFVLDVQHILKVEIPPGGNHVLLEPEGGWQSWLESGRKPVRLFRDQAFLIYASSKFSMKIECEHDLGFGSGCGIIDRESGYAGRVDVSVSLPHGLTDSGGQPAKRFPLKRETSSAFQPGIYVDRKPGTLHFDVDQQHTNWLILNAKGRPYTGNITVIWDSEVD
jgi:hypothetical protein